MGRKIIIIEADKKRQLKFNYRALLELEKNGIDVFALHKHRRFDDIMYMFQVGFMHEEEISRDKMMDLMDVILSKHNIGESFELIVDAIVESLRSDADVERETNEEVEDLGK